MVEKSGQHQQFSLKKTPFDDNNNQTLKDDEYNATMHLALKASRWLSIRRHRKWHFSSPLKRVIHNRLNLSNLESQNTGVDPFSFVHLYYCT